MTNDVSKIWARWETNFIGHMARLRERLGLTQTDLAKALQEKGFRFHQQTVQRIEAGTRPVRLDEAFVIAEVLGVDVATMTTSSAPTDTELRYAVDRVRREAVGVASLIGESLGDFWEDFEVLAANLYERELGKSSDDLDAATRWGMSFTLRAFEALQAMNGVERQLLLLAGGREDELPLLPAGLATDVGEWLKRYGDLLPMEPESSRALYDSMKAESDG